MPDTCPATVPDWPWLMQVFSGSCLLHEDCTIADIVQRVGGGRLAYLATPYTKLVLDDDRNFDWRAHLKVRVRTSRWAAELAIEGVTAASPVLMACAICESGVTGCPHPLDEAFWSRWCQPMLAASGAVIVPPMAGWDVSRGVWREVCWSLRQNRPVYLIAPPETGGDA
ncbi:DUF1937 family protein [Paracoccus sp. (in: a-proteobacteria)]|uniref:DUF1937 family protein n=1 Tax=Paracoccus sp. TaxID=267 RepID=UPI003A8AAFBF